MSVVETSHDAHSLETLIEKWLNLAESAESAGKQLCLHPPTLILIYISYDEEKGFLPEDCTLNEKFPILSATSPMQNIQGGCYSDRMGFALADRVSSAERPMKPKQRHSEKIDVEDSSN